ncbi:glycoside hydrolase family 20 zincin-like fold domain-containing protein [Compostibacter hankyongensis]|uniref:Beta-N-acetylhexosaminidase n=1 Tax=Compostibacter hankyongensis TaxID=1007089 RepID=A0ABP8G0X6_9BACT
MKFLISSLALCLLCTTFSASAAPGRDSLTGKFSLLPRPQKLEWQSGPGIAANALRGIHLQGIDKRPVLYGTTLAALPVAAQGGKGVLSLTLSDDPALPESPEGYILTIANGEVAIRARAAAGLFYGCQTLGQLLEDARDQQVPVPACRITDYPDIAYRAVHLDLKHHMDHVRYYYDMMDRLARIKVNAVIVEFEDKLRYRKAKAVGASDAISVEQFAALSRYAHDRNIEISPLVQGLGHASFILKHEEYKRLREDSTSDWAFSPLDPDTYKLQFSLYEDAIAATPYGKYLHVGGDEVGRLGSSALSKKSGMKPFELQMYWLRKVCEFAKAHHRIPIFWDDMVFKLADLYKTTYDPALTPAETEKIWSENRQKLDENIRLFPTNCVYMRWSYSHPSLPGNINALRWYKTNHLSAMAATAAQQTAMMLPREHSNFESIKDFCRITAEQDLDGILCTVWDDSSPHFETVWRGLHYFALFSWHYTDIPLQQAAAIFRHRFYGPALSDPTHEIEDVLERSLPFWETALLEKGGRKSAVKEMDLVALPDAGSPGTWSEKYRERLADARVALARYDTVRNRIRTDMKLAGRNRYSLELLDQLNALQIYPSQLLILLEAYDKAPASGKKAKLNEIRQYVGSFAKRRKQFEAVFAQTRVLSKPDDYLQDSNFHHHIANTTRSSDWMYLVEMAMNAEIRKWTSLENTPSQLTVPRENTNGEGH